MSTGERKSAEDDASSLTRFLRHPATIGGSAGSAIFAATLWVLTAMGSVGDDLSTKVTSNADAIGEVKTAIAVLQRQVSDQSDTFSRLLEVHERRPHLGTASLDDLRRMEGRIARIEDKLDRVLEKLPK